MSKSVRFPYLVRDPAIGPNSKMPFAPLSFIANDRSLSGLALLDTGATVNVLPYSVGQQLNLSWDEQSVPVRLGGNLASTDAKAVALEVSIESWPPVLLVFAWTRVDSSPIILGQMNFFEEFDVCFYRGRGEFVVSR